jgi:hypothetical protein
MLTSTCCHAPIPTELVMQLVSKMPEGVGGSVEQLCVVGWLQPPCWSSGGIFSCTPISERTEGCGRKLAQGGVNRTPYLPHRYG